MPQYAPVFNLATLNGTNGFRLDGANADDGSGGAVATTGDINGDGFADLIIGATGIDNDAGGAYVVFGTASGWASSLELSVLDGSNGFRLNGIDPDDYAGTSVAFAGDINGDGIDDLIIGAEGADPNGASRAGETYVVFGTVSGWDATIDLSALDGTNGFRLEGVNAIDISGASVAGAGDVNGDGFADIIIGARWADPQGRTDVGASYVVFGSDGGWPSSLDLSSLNGTNGFRIDGVSKSLIGQRVAGAGDINGDGFDDLLIGRSGVSYVVFGAATGFSATFDLSALDGSNGFRLVRSPDGYFGASVAGAGDVNGDGFADFIIGAPGAGANGQSYVVFGKAGGWTAVLGAGDLNGSNGFRLNGIDSGDSSGLTVAAAGDVNGDGFDDLIVSAPFADPGGDMSAGETYVVFGKAGGWTANLNLAALNGNNGFRLEGIDPNDRSGRGVSGGGDVNGDGIADLVIGAPGGDPNGSGSGETYVVFGSRPGEAVTRVGTAMGNRIFGGNFADTLEGLAGDDRLDGGGGNDTLKGGADADELVGGAGLDVATYAVSGSGVSVSLATGLGSGGDAQGDTLLGIESLIGSAFADVLSGDGLANSLKGNLGADTLTGGGGNDSLDGAGGADALNGGAGIDTVTYAASAVRVVVDLTAGTGAGGMAQGDTLTAIENVTGSAFNDVLTGSTAANTLSGGTGNDTLSGAANADTLLGGAGNDKLDGGLGADMLNGGAGDDGLDGGLGADLLTGSTGQDSFVFSTAPDAANIDTIGDFSAVNDTIALDNAVFAGIGPTGGLNAARFVIAAAATDISDRIIYNAATGALFYDADGTGASAQVQFAALTAGLPLTAADFMVI